MVGYPGGCTLFSAVMKTFGVALNMPFVGRLSRAELGALVGWDGVTI